VPIFGRVDVLGVPVCAASVAGAQELVYEWIERGEHRYATFTGVHGLMESQRSSEVLEAHLHADLVACDGMPLVCACRRVGYGDAERVYGSDFMLAIAERASRRGWGIFLYGGHPGTAEELGRVLTRRFAGLRVPRDARPPFRELSDKEDGDIVSAINGSGAEIVFVGLSTPKQERWMATHRDRLHVNALLGVGAAFDFHTGRVRQAPPWMQRSGLEWLFRLGTEPRRLAGRYLRNNPAFVRRILADPPRRIS
jgi:N-acetylglucosaminyldiphosphoundecaprenol N-acetyl-beta-D-mannosaminyltransferase